MPKLVCHRHLIERFGANSPLGIIVRRLLKVTNETKYLQMSKEIDAELKLYIKYKQEYSTLDEKTLNKINNIKIMISGINANSNSNYFVYKWAQWLRTDYHVGRCTNHAEGAHGNINSSMERRGATNFSSGLSTTINYILNFFQNRKNNHGTSFANRHLKMRNKIIKLLNTSEENIKNSIENCKCDDHIFNEALFGIQFPCMHQILKRIYSSQQCIDFQKINSNIKVEKFIIYFLEKITCYNKMYNDDDIESKCEILIQNYSSEHSINLEKMTTFSFIRYLLTLFTYNLPNFLEFNEDYSENSIQIDEVQPIVISKADKSRPKKIEKVNNSDLQFWTRNCKNDIQKLCKTKYYETVNEILFIYKDIGQRVYSLCNDNYDIFMSEIYLQSENIIESENKTQMPNILNQIANFKIKCWYDADVLMKDNKFI